MTNDPRNPLPGEQPGTPYDPQNIGMGQTPGQPGSGQPGSGQPGSGQPGSGQQPVGGQQPTPTTRSTAAGATPVSASQPRSQEPRTQTTTQTSQTTQPQPTTRSYEAPRRSNNKRIALFGVLGLAAVAGIITGFAATNSSTSPVAAVHRTIPRHIPFNHAPVSTGRLLTTFSESGGTHTSAPFTVTNPATVHYGYKCSTGSHNFSASMATTSGGNHQSIANTTGTGISQARTLHPSSTGSSYRISASSACPYVVRVYAR